MLNHHALAVLANRSLITASKCQQALQLFASYDLSVPRRLPPRLLDTEYGWPPGTTAATLTKLARMRMLVVVGSHLWMLAPEYTWTPATLAEQWAAQQQVLDRIALAARQE